MYTVLRLNSKGGSVLALISRNIAHSMYKFLLSLLGIQVQYCLQLMKVVLISFSALFNINEGETVWVQNKASNSVWTCCHLERVAARTYSLQPSALQPLL